MFTFVNSVVQNENNINTTSRKYITGNSRGMKQLLLQWFAIIKLIIIELMFHKSSVTRIRMRFTAFVKTRQHKLLVSL